MDKQKLTQLLERRERAIKALDRKTQELNGYHEAVTAAEHALMGQVLWELHNGTDFIVLACKVFGVQTPCDAPTARECGRSLAERLGYFFRDWAYSTDLTHWSN